MRHSGEGVNIINELFKRSRKPCNMVSTCIGHFAEQKTAESQINNQAIPLAGNVRATIIVAFSSDNTLMASTHGDHHVRVTVVRTHECIMTLTGHPRTPLSVTFHPSSNEILASGCLGGEVRVWDLHGGSEMWVSEHHTAITSLSFHPLDQVLAIATSNQIFLWNWNQPKPFASVKTKCLAERVRLIRFSTLGDFLLTGISNIPQAEQDLIASSKSMFNGSSSSSSSFQRPRCRRFFQVNSQESMPYDWVPHPARQNTDNTGIPYTQTTEYRVRRAGARRDRSHLVEAARASNQTGEVRNLLSSRTNESANILFDPATQSHQSSRSGIAQARLYAASVSLESVANRATDALVSGEGHGSRTGVMSHDDIMNSVLSNVHEQRDNNNTDDRHRNDPVQRTSVQSPSQNRTGDSQEPASERSNGKSLPRTGSNSVLQASIEQRNVTIMNRLNYAQSHPQTGASSNQSRQLTALELRTILHPELTLNSSMNNRARASQNNDASTSAESSQPRRVPQIGEPQAQTSMSVDGTQSVTSDCASNGQRLEPESLTPVMSHSAGTSQDDNDQCQRKRIKPSSSRLLNPAQNEQSPVIRRKRMLEGKQDSNRRNEDDAPSTSSGFSSSRRINPRRIQSPGPLTRASRPSRIRRNLQYRGRLLADESHCEVRRSRVGVHRLSRAMDRVRPAQQPLHRHYDVSIFDEEIGRPSRNVHAVVNSAIANAFYVRGESAVANNISNTTHRLQWWDFSKQELPDISNVNTNVVVQHCKIHNDSSCDISQDSQILATFVPSPYGFPDNGVLAIYSLKPHNFGDVVYTKSFGPNAICVSLSPLSGYVVVGLAAKRLHCWHQTSRRLMAQVFRMEKPYAGENSLVQVNSILHVNDGDQRQQVSVNVVKWIPHPGAGIVYGTSKGDLRICLASNPAADEDLHQGTWVPGSQGDDDMYSRYSIDRAQRVRFYNDLSLLTLGFPFPEGQHEGTPADRPNRIARSTQTGEETEDLANRQSTSTQTEQATTQQQSLSDESAVENHDVGINIIDGVRPVDEAVGVAAVEEPTGYVEHLMAHPTTNRQFSDDARHGANVNRNEATTDQGHSQRLDRETGESV